MIYNPYVINAAGKWKKLKAQCQEGLGQYKEAAELYELLGEVSKADENYDRAGVQRPLRPSVPRPGMTISNRLIPRRAK
jgi:hypothetical protein